MEGRRKRVGKDLYTQEQLEAIPREELTEEQRKDLKEMRRRKTLAEKKAKTARKSQRGTGDGQPSSEGGDESERKEERADNNKRRADKNNDGKSGEISESAENSDVEVDDREERNAPGDSSSHNSINHDGDRSRDSDDASANSEALREEFEAFRRWKLRRDRGGRQNDDGEPQRHNDSRLAAKLAHQVIPTYDGNPRHTRVWTHLFRQITSDLKMRTKQLLFFEKLSMEVKGRFNGLYRDMFAHPVETYLQWLEKAFYTPDSELAHHERLENLQWDALGTDFSLFLQQFELATTHVLNMTDTARKIALWKKLPESLRNGLQFFFNTTDYYGLVKLVADNENLKRPRQFPVNNVATAPVTCPETPVVPGMEANEVNAIDRASHQRDSRNDRDPRKSNHNSFEPCRYCHRRNHRSEDCKDHIKCNWCGINGHKEFECRKKARANKRPRTDGNNGRHNNDHRDNDPRERNRKEPTKH
jgi:hypothetical protein